MRKGRNDFQRLTCLAGLLLRRQEPHGSHIVQPVGDLNHQHAGIASHRDDHLPDGLALGGATQHHLVQLGDTVDQMPHFVAEVVSEGCQGVAGVLDGVMQQRGHQRGGVHTQFGKDAGDRQRVSDVGIPGAARLGGARFGSVARSSARAFGPLSF